MYELIILLIILIFIVDQNVIFSQKFYSLLSKDDYRLPILYKKKKITLLSRIHPYMFDPTILSIALIFIGRVVDRNAIFWSRYPKEANT